MKSFDYSLDYANLNLRERPDLYRIGRGEQGVLTVGPYKSEILPHWRFKTPDIARDSSEKIYDLFLRYKEDGDFVGMDMARKFLQMGYTRSRRYANHQGGRKYASEDGKELPRDEDSQKAKCAEIFKAKWQEAKQDSTYIALKNKHLKIEKG